MDPAHTELERERLALARDDRDIATGEGRIRRQLKLATRVRESGEDSARADNVLDVLEATLGQWKAHRDLIAERIVHLETVRDAGSH